MFKSVKNQVSFPELEKEILEFWQKNNVFQESIDHRDQSKPFVFYDGPPFATGLPHYGHLLASTVKDIVPRYYSMRGYRVERRFGWDCHGLPVEMEIQNKLGLKSNEDIEEYGVDKFNEACREIVLRYSSEWKSTINKLGRWVDFENDYKTMDHDFMESVWWVFKRLYDKGLIYKGFKVLPYSWKAGTILSNFEANLNYRDVDDPSITIKFRSVENENEFFLAWTTTPWTTVSNLALAVNPNLDYVKVKKKGEVKKESAEIYYLSEHSFNGLPDREDYEVLERLKGERLNGKKYQPLFPYVASYLEKQISQGKVTPAEKEKCFTIYAADFVAEGEGVGIVHITSAYGEEDYNLTSRHGIPNFDGVNREGNFIADIDFVAGENIKEADKKIIKRLKEMGLIFEHKTIKHSYPYCWRTDTPLMYKAISTWFVKVESLRDQLVEINQGITWLPQHIKDGRFGKWLENVQDWAISRNRFWGTPLPIWESADGEVLCYGDIASLENDSGEKIDDLHKQFIDKIVIEKNGKTYHRIPEVLDCWFESGSMPYAHKHYPFENKASFESQFPADFISEGIDQTRGWFYTLLVIATGLFGKSSFKNVIVSGLILAEDGKKMSKRLKNYPDPNYVLDNYGADALRVYLIYSNVIKAETLRFSEKGLKDITKNIMIPLWNSLSFLTTYGSMDGWEYEEFATQDLTNPLDRWILSCQETLIREVNHSMENYELYHAVPPLVKFIDKVTNGYIRRSRKRFWKSEKDEDKSKAYFTLYKVLRGFSVILAPFMPFVSEQIYQILKKKQDKKSVHLNDYPIFNEANVDQLLEKEIGVVDKVISLARSLRLKHKIKIRQPLNSLSVITKDEEVKRVSEKFASIIKEELNVKEIKLNQDEEGFVDYKAKVNFKLWGKKLGEKIKPVNQKLMSLSSEQIREILNLAEAKSGGPSSEAGSLFELELEGGEKIKLSFDAVDIRREGKPGFQVSHDQGITCALDVSLDETLIFEGLAREVVNRIQKKRKDLDLEYNQSITIEYEASPKLAQAIQANRSYIVKETLTQELKKVEGKVKEGDGVNEVEEVGEEKFSFKIKI